ncbi:hypothetical protein HPB50_017344 [Hyalomma asiaticum]|uniref:Uncharacterized protein n=1 Tax=Hyalomma asiaticum TaxID=266040 RepID=A0ACB7RRU3_HYAAI|nr:hypothetical protein HPB50_017344 [Hyalomma asiaticum]
MTRKSSGLSPIRVMVMGSQSVGKSDSLSKYTKTKQKDLGGWTSESACSAELQCRENDAKRLSLDRGTRRIRITQSCESNRVCRQLLEREVKIGRIPDPSNHSESTIGVQGYELANARRAVTVRFLTRRFISEYSSMKDLLYRHTVLVDNRTIELEILDTSRYQENKFPEDKMGWADALVVVYSIEDRWSFEEASLCLQKVQQLCPCLPTILVANKRDLSHVRQVDVDDGRQLSLQLHCQFFEVSAADSYAGVSMAFQSILREVLATKILRSLTPVRRRLTVVTVSKMLGAVFGKNGKRHKKRPSLSL